jgi:hypothetical protein
LKNFKIQGEIFCLGEDLVLAKKNSDCGKLAESVFGRAEKKRENISKTVAFYYVLIVLLVVFLVLKSLNLLPYLTIMLYMPYRQRAFNSGLFKTFMEYFA